ncbi:hypothetical protein HOE425_331704 [Hoeflea sp. EC-HK425]|nr:hypothetical protein HOE425_331704 [Hoeflea sp. EC-HK425]
MVQHHDGFVAGGEPLADAALGLERDCTALSLGVVTALALVSGFHHIFECGHDDNLLVSSGSSSIKQEPAFSRREQPWHWKPFCR